MDLSALTSNNVLSASSITALLADADNSDRVPKGYCKAQLIRFANSGDHYLDFTTLPKYKNHTVAAIAQSIKTYIDSVQSIAPCTFLKDENSVLVINLKVNERVYAEELAAKEAAEADATDES